MGVGLTPAWLPLEFADRVAKHSRIVGMSTVGCLGQAMLRFESPIAHPPLTRLELQMYQLLRNIRIKQTEHICSDIDMPRSPSIWRLLFTREKSMQEWRETLKLHCEMNREPRFLDPLPLDRLLPLVKPPRKLRPGRIEGEDAYFKDFLISQRRRPHVNGGELSYLVAAPVAAEPARCVVVECSGRAFCTEEPKSNCEPPSFDDFLLLRIRSMGFDLQGALTVPTTMDMYLPGCYGPWQLLRHPSSEVEESILASQPQRPAEPSSDGDACEGR